MSYLFGEKLSTTYKQVIAIGGDDDRVGISATAQKAIWTDDGSGGINAFPLTAAQDALQITSTNRLEFNDDTAYIYGSSSGVLATSAATSTVIGTALFDLNASSGITIDGTTVSIDGTGASNFSVAGADLTLETTSSGNIELKPVGYIQVASGKKLQFADSGEYISGDTTNLTLGSGADIILSATNDVNVPQGIGLSFATDDAEKIESDGTDLTINSGAKINLTCATGDVHIPKNIGLVFDDNASEKIESDNTNLTINSGADINLTCATGDVNIPADIGLTMGSDNQKIEGDGTDLAISATGNINVTSTVNEANSIYLRANAGTSETIKIHADQGTAVTEGAASLSLLSDAGGVELRSTADLANAINLTVDGGSTSSMTLFNDQGTSVTEGSASIQLLSDAGGIGIKSTANLASAILLTVDGGTSETIKIHADQGTGAGSIELTSDAGGIDVNVAAGKTFAVDAGIFSIDSTTSSNVTMTADTGSTQTLTVSSTNADGSYAGNLVLNADGVVHIRANDTTNSYAGAGIQIGTDLSGVDIAIGHTTSDVRIGDNLLVTGDSTVSGDLTVTGALTYGSVAATSTSISGTAPILTLANTTDENSALDGAVNTSVGSETKIVFKGDRDGGETNILSSIVVGHVGTSDDQKGQMQFFVNSGSQSDTALSLAMSLVETGYLGIGVADPDSPREILNTSTQLKLSYDATNYASFNVAADGLLTITTVDPDGAEADIALMPDGNVGIGTASPQNLLHVESTTDLKFRLSYDADDYMTMATGSDGQTTITTVDSDGTAGHIALMPDGNVGIGTTTPGSQLTIESASGAVARFNRKHGTIVADDLIGQIVFSGDDDGDEEDAAFIRCYGDQTWSSGDFPTRMSFWTCPNGGAAPLERITIKGNGNVGIGTSVTDAILYVKDADADLATTPIAVFYSNSASTSTRNLVEIQNDHASADDAVCLSINQDGADYCIYGNGGFLTTGGVWTDSSDVLRKENITDLSYGLADVLKLRPVKFNYKHHGEVGLGFIAQEIEKIIPEVVSGEDARIEAVLNETTGELEKDKIVGGKGVTYGQFTSVLVKAIQELSAKVTALENA